ncbi:probable polyol transporter 6 [Momordica charantia]|uniref:Probable polyol transporter 6 n=1 Tax=Momordica charantia TaxID=3673 RepID=A0A6J1CTF7_MOMCH|nr:probable polyol transporter 6 [Momordica charantia]
MPIDSIPLKSNKLSEMETSSATAMEAIELEKDSKSQSKGFGINKYTLICSVLASTNSILLGYDIGVMSGAVLYIEDNLKISSTQVEILVGSLNVLSLIGSLASGRTSDSIGRRYTTFLASTTFLVGALLMGLAPSFPLLLAGRMIAGVGVGYALMVAPVYTAELSPATSRGLLSSLPEIFITLGILLGYIINYALSDLPPHMNWRIMLGLAGVPALVVGVGVLAMPESPRWLVMKGKLEEAKKVLIKISINETEAEERLEAISTAADADAAAAAASGNWHGQGVWKELLINPTKPIRRMLIAAIGINFFMQASGNDAVMYYSPEVFRAAGIHRKRHLFGVNVVMGVTKTCFVLFSALYLDRFGRRPLLLVGSSGMTVALGLLGLGSKCMEKANSRPTWAVVVSIVALCGDVALFSIGLGPITWVYTTEIFPNRIRAQGSSLAISLNRLVSGVVSMTFLSISKEITFGGMFFVLSGIMAMATLFFYFFLPETKGKSLEEIELLFHDNHTHTTTTTTTHKNDDQHTI